MAELGKPAGSADSFIGSLLSLISKYEIRYEGVLCSINTEESTVGLQNVRVYGTEGRKKDGPHIPPSDNIYDYILFRGSDLKDLQVKSSPPVHEEQKIHNDPAIIQSHYVCSPLDSSTSALVRDGALTDLRSHGEPSALPQIAYPDVLPSYLPGAYLGSWCSSPATENANKASLSMPMHWQGYYGSSSSLQNAQQWSLPFQPPPTVPVPLMLQNHLPYPAVQEPLNTSMENLLKGVTPISPLIPSANSVPCNFTSALTPSISTFPSDIASSLSIKASLPSHSSYTTSNIVTMYSRPLSSQDIKALTAPVFGTGGAANLSAVPIQSSPPSSSSIPGSTSGPFLTKPLCLLTPNQLTQPGPPLSSSSQNLYPDQKDVDDLTAALSKPSSSVCTPLQETLLHLPLSTQQSQHSTSQFTEEFDFIAMNEKFKKDELWDYLGKARQRHTTEMTGKIHLINMWRMKRVTARLQSLLPNLYTSRKSFLTHFLAILSPRGQGMHGPPGSLSEWILTRRLLVISNGGLIWVAVLIRLACRLLVISSRGLTLTVVAVPMELDVWGIIGVRITGEGAMAMAMAMAMVGGRSGHMPPS